MKNNVIKCSLLNHQESDAILFCQDCKIYMCKKCESHHSELFKHHNQIALNSNVNINEIFTGICTEKNHPYELKYFCKTHNKLCCAECITKIKGDENGQHKDCNVCLLKDIKSEKLNKLKANIKQLEELSLTIKESINQIKLIFEKVENDKEKLKLDVQNVFTKLRNALNIKEDEILLQIDKAYEQTFSYKDIIKKSEKLPDKIKLSIDKGKLIETNVENSKLNSIINDCLIIEKYINDITKINMDIKNFNSKQNEIYFTQNEKEIIQFTDKINNLQLIYQTSKSEIINKNDFDKINKWLEGNYKFVLRYSAKIDGCSTEIFHEKCDNISGCIIICKPVGLDIIGGYISTKILKNNNYYDDNKAFLFNLTQNFVRKNKKSYSNAIKNFSDSSYFIRFGNSCQVFILSGNCLNDNNSMVTYCSCTTNFDCDNYDLFNSKGKSFKVENFEVFEVI